MQVNRSRPAEGVKLDDACSFDAKTLIVGIVTCRATEVKEC